MNRAGIVRSLGWCALVVIGIGFGGDNAAAMPGRVFRNPCWGRFAPGTWRVARLELDTLDERGAVMETSVAETRTTLAEATDNSVVLDVQEAVEIAGKKLPGVPKQIVEGAEGAAVPPTAERMELGTEPLEVAGTTFQCQLVRTEFDEASSHTVVLSWYSDEPEPRLLKRLVRRALPDSGETIDESVMRVVALDRTFQFAGRLRAAFEVETVHTHAGGGQSITRGLHCAEVPGCVVEQQSEERDRAGRLLRRGRFRLINFQAY